MTTSRGLTLNQLRELEGELRAERARLERSLAVRPDRGGSTFGNLDSAAATAEGGLMLALETRTYARYGAILDALTRLASGSFGTCVSCSNRIPYDRLIVMPEVAWCMACGPRA